jgi:hypothetical protein
MATPLTSDLTSAEEFDALSTAEVLAALVVLDAPEIPEGATWAEATELWSDVY